MTLKRHALANAIAFVLFIAVVSVSVPPASALTMESGTTTEAGEITGITYSSGNTSGGLEVVTLFRNTGSHHLTGLVNIVTLRGAGGEVLARAEIPCSGQMLVPGEEAMCIADLGLGISAGASMLDTRIQDPDGTILASQEQQLQAGDVAGLDTAPSTSAPGFGAFLGVLAVAVIAGRVKRPPRTGSPPGAQVSVFK
ncbi:MAG TPA: hypothetical protein VMT31_05880 [Methanomicrobiales archaeon]|nr:hypothetical protein [Methanomicrobiales archaeon]